MEVKGKKVLVFGSGSVGSELSNYLQDGCRWSCMMGNTKPWTKHSLRGLPERRLAERTGILENSRTCLEETGSCRDQPGSSDRSSVIVEAMRAKQLRSGVRSNLHMRMEKGMCLRSQERMERRRQQPCLVRSWRLAIRKTCLFRKYR